MFAALNTVEPPIQTLFGLDLFHAGEAWASARRPTRWRRCRSGLPRWRTGSVDAIIWRTGSRRAILLMITVLRILRHTDIVSERPALKTYQERCEARPAFRKALADHLKPFEAQAA